MNTEVEWFDEARLTYERLPADVQVALAGRLRKLFDVYPPLYQRKPPDIEGVATVAHLQVPEWGCWLVMETEYYVEAGIPTLCVVRLEELSQREFEQSVTARRAQGGGIQG